MKSLFAMGRLWLTVVLLGASLAVTQWVRKGYTFEVRPLHQELSAFPLQFDDWQGTDVPIEDGVLRLLAADSVINRTYQHPDQGSVMLHASVWVHPRKVAAIAPHLPKICYSNVGWNIEDERQVSLQVADTEIPVTMLALEKQGSRIVVAYWYQIGDERFNTAEEARRLHRQLWGQPVWPATVKVLLQTSAESIDQGLPILEQFVRRIQPQLRDL